MVRPWHAQIPIIRATPSYSPNTSGYRQAIRKILELTAFLTSVTATPIRVPFASLSEQMRVKTVMAAVEYTLEAYKIAPIRRLPPEILVEILSLAADGASSYMPKSLFKVTAVCHLWRQIALGEARFWKSIHFIDRKFKFNLIPLWLGRAGVRSSDCYPRYPRLRCWGDPPLGTHDARH